MKERIVLISLFILAFVCWGFGAWQYISENNLRMLILHMVLSAELAYFIPGIWVDKESHLTVYIWEIFIGLIAFFWMYVKVFNADFAPLPGVYMLIFIDGQELMLVGMCLTIICIVADNRKLKSKIRKF